MIDWGDKEEEPLPPIEQLHAEAELLRMIEYWRTEHDKLLLEKRYRIGRWRREKKNNDKL